MEQSDKFDILNQESNCFEILKNVLENFMNEANDTVIKVLDSEVIQNGAEISLQVSEAVLGSVKVFKAMQKITSIPTILYMKKFEKYCKGLITIPLEKRQNYIKILGKDKINKEDVFVLNVINRVEEIEKIPLFIKLLSAKMDEIIDDSEYRRLMILTDRTLYSDLLYLEHNITDDPIRLQTDSDYGLVSSGLLVNAGNEWKQKPDITDNGIRFNYTSSAKKMAYIFWGIECSMEPSNKGITILHGFSEKMTDSMEEGFLSVFTHVNKE